MQDKLSFDLRGEYYSDRNNVIVKTDHDQPFRTYGISCNMDYQVAENALWRIEVRYLSWSDAQTEYNTFVTTCLAVAF